MRPSPLAGGIHGKIGGFIYVPQPDGTTIIRSKAQENSQRAGEFYALDRGLRRCLHQSPQCASAIPKTITGRTTLNDSDARHAPFVSHATIKGASLSFSVVLPQRLSPTGLAPVLHRVWVERRPNKARWRGAVRSIGQCAPAAQSPGLDPSLGWDTISFTCRQRAR